MPIDNKIAMSDSKNDQQRLSQAILQLVTKQTKYQKCGRGIPSNHVFTTVADVERWRLTNWRSQFVIRLMP